MARGICLKISNASRIRTDTSLIFDQQALVVLVEWSALARILADTSLIFDQQVEAWASA